MAAQIDAPGPHEDALGLQAPRLDVFTAAATGEDAIRPHHPMPRQAAAAGQLGEHPAHQTCPPWQAGKGCDFTVGAHEALRNGRHDQPDPLLAGRVIRIRRLRSA